MKVSTEHMIIRSLLIGQQVLFDTFLCWLSLFKDFRYAIKGIFCHEFDSDTLHTHFLPFWHQYYGLVRFSRTCPAWRHGRSLLPPLNGQRLRTYFPPVCIKRLANYNF